MQGVQIRARLLAVLAAGLTLGCCGSAQASAGDDAHAVTTKLSAIPDASQAPSNVACPSGEHAIGGGVRPSPTGQTGYFLAETGPLIDAVDLPRDGDAPTQWFARMTNLSGKAKDFVFYAVCSASTDAIVRTKDFATVGPGAASEATTTVSCAANERVIGGGVLGKSAPPLSVEASMPLSAQGTIDGLNDGDVARSWFIDARANGPQLLRAYAVCSATSQATIQVETTFFPNSGYTLNMYVPCPSGQRALAGGVGTMQPNLSPGIEANTPGNSLGSALITTGGVAGGWFARVHNAGPQGGASYRVAAICEGPTPGTTVPPPPPPPDPDDPTPVDPLNPTVATPSNAFKFGRLYRHKDRGIGALVLKVPGPGEVILRSSKFKFQANIATEPGKIGLSILAAKGGPQDKLDRTGKLKAKAKITYTPDSGAPNTEKIKLKLLKN